MRFSTLVEIIRGGSPRPIKDYLTSEVDGINWIKIGDTEKGEKYINNVKEKIKKSGLNKTRFVKKGTFLLTNSMSFGRPYILNVDGAIHDGWRILALSCSGVIICPPTTAKYQLIHYQSYDLKLLFPLDNSESTQRDLRFPLPLLESHTGLNYNSTQSIH